jgi:hypothetical protein
VKKCRLVGQIQSMQQPQGTTHLQNVARSSPVSGMEQVDVML